jgi:hypothetical protein
MYVLDTSRTQPIPEPLPLETPGNDAGRIAQPGNPTPDSGKLKADVFTGTLEAIDTACFADGECFATVNGKHVTVLRGWSRDTVGSVQGVPGFGDLEGHIGKQVEVYAQVLPDGTYTLYGSEGFYLKLVSETMGGKGGNTTPSPMPPVAIGECVVGGCSNQLCLDAALADGMMSTCEWREEYSCYRSATCERQADGACGWTATSELSACLEKAGTPTL